MKTPILILASTATLLISSCALFDPDYKEFKKLKQEQDQTPPAPYDAPSLPENPQPLPQPSVGIPPIQGPGASNPFAVPPQTDFQNLPALPGGVGTAGNPAPVIGGPVMDIPNGGDFNPIPFGQTINHTVVSGDSIWALARKYNVKQADILSANNLSSSMIKVGEVLKIPQR